MISVKDATKSKTDKDASGITITKPLKKIKMQGATKSKTDEEDGKTGENEKKKKSTCCGCW